MKTVAASVCICASLTLLSLSCDAILPFSPNFGVWEIPALLGAARTGGNPQIACDNAGNAFAVWQAFNGSITQIWATQYSKEKIWTTPNVISINSGSAGFPQIAVDGIGNAVAVWQQHDGAKNRIWANYYSVGANWGTAQPIDLNIEDARDPQVIINSLGNVIAVWNQHNGTRIRIWANHFTFGSIWGTAQPIDLDSGSTSSAKLAVDVSDNFYVVWKQPSGVNNEIWVSQFTAGNWSISQLFNYIDGSASTPQITFDSIGNAVALWQQYDGTKMRIWANYFLLSTGWSVAQPISIDYGFAQAPRLSSSTSGNFIAVWMQDDGDYSDCGIWVNFLTPGKDWGLAQRIDSSIVNARDPRIAVNKYGYSMVIWSENNGSISRIGTNYFLPGIGWDSTRYIDTGSWGTMRYPQICIDCAGNGMAIWQQELGSSQLAIWARHFNISSMAKE